MAAPRLRRLSRTMPDETTLQPSSTLPAPSSPTPMTAADVPDDARVRAMLAWLAGAPGGLAVDTSTMRPASSDASFRRYFRFAQAGAGQPTVVVMDAPPSHEDVRPFVHVAGVLRAAGVHTPDILATDTAQGFLLLSDLGSTTYLSALDQARDAGDMRACDGLMRDALTALVRLQGADGSGLPPYDEARLRTELDLFPAWYVGRHLGAELSGAEQAALSGVFEALLKNNLAQPRVPVHRDYHARNLMVLPEGQGNPGVLDFQDAVVGPITYDLVSLLRDAYIDWPEEQQLDWAIRYWEQARAAGLPVQADFADFYLDFEWMGLQRQLKVLGIFARLHHRDGKDQYLGDMPRVLGYARAVAGRYGVFAPLLRLFDRLQGVTPKAAYTF